MRKIIIYMIVLFYTFEPQECNARSDLYGKVEIGYIKANKYSDYTPGRFDKIHRAQASNNILYGVELMYKINEIIMTGVALELSNHRFSKSCLADDSSFLRAKIKVQSLAMMWNGYYFHQLYHFKPYLLAGIGVVKNRSSNYLESAPGVQLMYRFPGSTKTNFAWQIGTGMQVPFYRNLLFDISVRYFNYGKTATKNMRYIQSPVIQVVDSPGVVGTRLRGGMATLGIVIKF